MQDSRDIHSQVKVDYNYTQTHQSGREVESSFFICVPEVNHCE